MKVTTVGLELAKEAFSLHGAAVDGPRSTVHPL